MSSPVYNIIAVPVENIEANDYNPNSVATPEMNLLYQSILIDGYTMPIVCYFDKDRDKYIIVDGFHRYTIMKKHKDTLIYNIPQYECVLTLSNTTDSVTIMGGNKSIKARPNSLIIVRAQGIEHEVTKVTTGERTFLKFIFTATDERATASGV